MKPLIDFANGVHRDSIVRDQMIRTGAAALRPARKLLVMWDRTGPDEGYWLCLLPDFQFSLAGHGQTPAEAIESWYRHNVVGCSP